LPELFEVPFRNSTRQVATGVIMIQFRYTSEPEEPLYEQRFRIRNVKAHLDNPAFDINRIENRRPEHLEPCS
jgi:hypothetical protein